MAFLQFLDSSVLENQLVQESDSKGEISLNLVYFGGSQKSHKDTLRHFLHKLFYLTFIPFHFKYLNSARQWLIHVCINYWRNESSEKKCDATYANPGSQFVPPRCRLLLAGLSDSLSFTLILSDCSAVCLRVCISVSVCWCAP